MIDDFTVSVLEETLELTTQAMPAERHPEVPDRVELIRGWMLLAILDPNNDDHKRTLRMGLSELCHIAHKNRQFLVAERLRRVARYLSPTTAPNRDVA